MNSAGRLGGGCRGQLQFPCILPDTRPFLPTLPLLHSVGLEGARGGGGERSGNTKDCSFQLTQLIKGHTCDLLLSHQMAAYLTRVPFGEMLPSCA